jgi:hypothetical protein
LPPFFCLVHIFSLLCGIICTVLGAGLGEPTLILKGVHDGLQISQTHTGIDRGSNPVVAGRAGI